MCCYFSCGVSIFLIDFVLASFSNESQFEMSKGISPIAALQKDLTEVERDLTLRKLLWESMDEWEVLLEKWKSTQFEALKVDGVQNDVTRFVQTVFLLEKGCDLFCCFHLISFLFHLLSEQGGNRKGYFRDLKKGL